MARSRTAETTSARDRARARRLELDAERAKRDELIEEAAAMYFEAADEREELLAQIEDADDRRAAAFQRLTELGESPARITALLEIDTKEIKALRGRKAPRQEGGGEHHG